MSFAKNQVVEATTAIKFGASAKVPRNTVGKVVRVEGSILSRKYAVRWVLPQYNNPVITVSGNGLRAKYSF
jgi:hypothetical protein